MTIRTFIEDDGTLQEAILLTPQDDPAAQKALETYIEATADENLAATLSEWLNQFDDSGPQTDGGVTTPHHISDDELTLTLSLLVDNDSTTVDTSGEATIRVRPDHGEVRIEAAEEADRTVEGVLAGSPSAIASLADRLYAAAATAAHETDESDPLDGDRDV